MLFCGKVFWVLDLCGAVVIQISWLGVFVGWWVLAFGDALWVLTVVGLVLVVCGACGLAWWDFWCFLCVFCGFCVLVVVCVFGVIKDLGLSGFAPVDLVVMAFGCVLLVFGGGCGVVWMPCCGVLSGFWFGVL